MKSVKMAYTNYKIPRKEDAAQKQHQKLSKENEKLMDININKNKVKQVWANKQRNYDCCAQYQEN